MSATKWITIVERERLRLSRSGNPRFVLTLADGTRVNTRPDSAYNYDVEDLTLPATVLGVFDGRGRLEAFGVLPAHGIEAPTPVTLTLTAAQARALGGLLNDYIEAHTDAGYEPAYNGDADLLSIEFPR